MMASLQDWTNEGQAWVPAQILTTGAGGETQTVLCTHGDFSPPPLPGPASSGEGQHRLRGGSSLYPEDVIPSVLSSSRRHSMSHWVNI